jgi:metal-responsive CopG/Arc/MetJ family transcriptional regulator
MRKYAISLPDYQADAIERIRHHRGVPRSRVIQQALELYLKSEQARDEADEIYAAGYRAFPEDAAEIEALTRTAAEVLEPEDWIGRDAG